MPGGEIAISAIAHRESNHAL